MPYRGVAAVVIVKTGNKKTKYTIENDAIVDIYTTGATYSGVRVTGVNRTGENIRYIAPEGGANEIPMSLITKVVDCGLTEFSGVRIG